MGMPGDLEVLERPRRLHAVVRVGGHGLLAQEIPFHPRRPAGGGRLGRPRRLLGHGGDGGGDGRGEPEASTPK